MHTHICYICARYWATQNYRKGKFTATALLIHWCAMQDHQGIAQHALDVHVVGFLASRLWTRIAMPKKEFGCLYYTGCCCFTAVIWDERWPSVLEHEEELSRCFSPSWCLLRSGVFASSLWERKLSLYRLYPNCFLLNFTVKKWEPCVPEHKNSDYKLQALQDGSLVNFTVPYISH